MSDLKKLISELCPNGVAYKELGQLCEIMNGKDYKSFPPGDIPVYGTGGIMTYIDRCAYDKPSVLLPRKGSIDKTYYVDVPFWTVDTIYWTKINDTLINPKYFYYFIQTINLAKISSGKGTIPSLTQAVLKKIEIPVPPLEVQSKIVETLDELTSLVSKLKAELEAELEARRKQYEYYRNELLNFAPPRDKNVKWMKMSDIGTFIRGKRFVRTDIVDEGVPCIHYGDMYTYYGLKADKAKTHLTPEKAQKMRFAKKNDVVIVGAGENKMDIGVGVAWLGNEDAAVHDACYIFRSDLDPEYVSHFLRTSDYHRQIYPLVSEGKICSISAQSIGRAVIPIPPMKEQRRIASFLNRFEALTTDLQNGLPAEIEARRKQYEYYRNLFMTLYNYEKIKCN